MEGKDVIIVDDMISSGESLLDVAKELKRQEGEKGLRHAATFGLFTNGLQKFDEYYGNGLIDRDSDHEPDAIRRRSCSPGRTTSTWT